MSYMLEQDQYTTVAALKRRLGLTPDEQTDDPQLGACVFIASRLIAEECWRRFGVDAAQRDYYYDAPPSDLLYISDLTDATPIEVWLGPDRMAETDFHLLSDDEASPYTLTARAPCYTAIRRLVDGAPAPWNAAALAEGRPIQKEVRVRGTGGYAAAVVDEVVTAIVPVPVEDATLRVAVRRWHAQAIQEGEGGGTSETGTTPAPAGLVDRIAQEQLGPFVHPRKPARKRGGAR